MVLKRFYVIFAETTTLRPLYATVSLSADTTAVVNARVFIGLVT